MSTTSWTVPSHPGLPPRVTGESLDDSLDDSLSGMVAPNVASITARNMNSTGGEVTSAALLPAATATWSAQLLDYVELTKPKISVLVLVTVAVSAYLGSWGPPDITLLLHTLLGTTLVAASASRLGSTSGSSGEPTP